MTASTIHPLAAEYLQRLRHIGRRLPRERRRELVAEIEAHLSDAIPPEASEADALTALDRLGTPEDIVEAEQTPSVASPRIRSIHEWAAIFLLLLGGFVFVVGWIAGLILLWSSRAWSTPQKWIGTLFIPGGLFTTYILGAAVGSSSVTCTGGSGIPTRCSGGPSTVHDVLSAAVLAILVLAPIASAIYLARRAR